MPARLSTAAAQHPGAHAVAEPPLELGEHRADEVPPERARAVIEVAVGAAELMLASGDSAAATTQATTRLAEAYGVPVTVETTYNRIVVSHQPGPDQPTQTVVRVAPDAGLDYDRLSRVEKLVDDVCDTGLDLSLTGARLRHIAGDARRYRAWARIGAAMLLGGGIAALLGGNLADVVACMVATLLVEGVRASLTTRGMGNFFTQLLAAVPPAALGLGVMAGRDWLPSSLRPHPSLVVAAGMVSLLAGIGVVMAAADAVDGYYVTASGRTMEVVVLSGAIGLGLIATLWLGLHLGVPAHLAPGGDSLGPVWVRVVCGGLVAACFAIGCNLHPHALGSAALLGVVAQGVYLGADQMTGSPVASSAVAAIVIGAVARLAHRQLHMPMAAITTTAIGSLMPGLLLYRGVYAMASREPRPEGASPATLLTQCVLTAVALAAGSSFGVSVGSVVLRLLRKGPRAVLEAPDAATGGATPGHVLFGSR